MGCVRTSSVSIWPSSSGRAFRHSCPTCRRARPSIPRSSPGACSSASGRCPRCPNTARSRPMSPTAIHRAAWGSRAASRGSSTSTSYTGPTGCVPGKAGRLLGLGSGDTERWQARLWRELARLSPSAFREHPKDRYLAALAGLADRKEDLRRWLPPASRYSRSRTCRPSTSRSSWHSRRTSISGTTC